MAEVLPASIQRLWTRSDAPPKQRGLLSARLRQVLVFAAVTLTLAGGAAGMAAWWRPLVMPGVIVLATEPIGALGPERSLAMQLDATALVHAGDSHPRVLLDEQGLTRQELQHMLMTLRLAKPHDHVLLSLSAAAGLSSTGDVVLFTRDASPLHPDAALTLTDVLSAIEECRATGTLVLLDLVPADAMTLLAVPPSDLPEKITASLQRHSFDRARVISACSAGEQSLLSPTHNRTLFGLLAEHGLTGAADGVIDRIADGRVSSAELIAYVQQELPKAALRLCGREQHALAVGQGPSFEVLIASAPRAQPAQAAEYPAWLSEAWDAYHARAASVDDETWEIWTSALRRAELAQMRGAPTTEIQSLQAKIAGIQAVTPLPEERIDEETPQLPADVEKFAKQLTHYLTLRAETLTSLPSAEAKPAAQKMLADFLKQEAKTEPGAVQAALVDVAIRPAFAQLEQWQAILEVRDAWPNLPTTDLLTSLEQLTQLRSATPDDVLLPKAARQALLVAREVNVLANDARTWPWTRQLLDHVWDERVHGETLLLARGYADSATAAAALADAAEQSRILRIASSELFDGLAAQVASQRFLASHVSLAETDAGLTLAFAQGCEALAELRSLLQPPRAPLASVTELRTFVHDVNRASDAVDASLTRLRDCLTAGAVTNAAAACREADADPHDLNHVALLLTSPELPSSSRKLLWESYGPLARNLDAQRGEGAVVARSASAVPLTAALDERRQQMHVAWMKLEKQPTVAASTAASESQLLWLRDWQRFRAAELTRVTSSSDRTVWSLASLDILGPFHCDALSPHQPHAEFALYWQQRSDHGNDVQIYAVSPTPALTIAADTQVAGQQPARFRLQLDTKRQGAGAKAAGFLAVLASGGRRYHAPIALPHVQSDQAIDILLSTSATELRLQEQLSLLGSDTQAFVWLENTTSQPQAVLVEIASIAQAIPVSLAPHEVQQVKLPPPTSPAPLTELAIQVHHAATQQTLGSRRLPFVVPAVSDVATVSSARVINTLERGPMLSVTLEAASNFAGEATLSLRPQLSSGTRELTVRDGRMRARLSSDQRRVELTAVLDQVNAGDALRCDVLVDGVREPLVLQGKTPARGEMSLLRALTTPAVTLDGLRITPPASSYLLTVAACNAPLNAQLQIALHSGSDASGAPILSRTVDATFPPQAVPSATTPAGGVTLTPIMTPTTEAFDTTGLVGRFCWQVALVSAGQTLAAAELPVTFDNLPPQGARFIRPPQEAAKGTSLALQVAAWDDLTDITEVQLFVGRPQDGKPSAGTKFATAKRDGEGNVWKADVVLPDQIGACDVTAQFTNAAGLVSFTTTPLTLLNSLPAAVGEIRGAVVEGARPQAGLEVTLEKTPGALLNKAKTDEHGAFVFSNITPGSYTVRANKPDASRHGAASVKVEAGQAATVGIKLAL